ncbi:MAG: PKD domain-containing protein [Bacteroidetes bacterium]|nr:MAG: PKD domain-containing protein [Bacteroidota bacterium]
MKTATLFFKLMLGAAAVLLLSPVFGQQPSDFSHRMHKKQVSYTHSTIRNKFYKPQQALTPASTPAQRTCWTMEAEADLRKRFPELPSLETFEAELQQKIREYEAQKAERGTEEVITIPVIVHVVHNGEPVGQGPNITAAQVQSQIDVLNEDYRRTGAGSNNHPAGADVEVQFALALFDPQGNRLQEPGIHRVQGGRDGWDMDPIQEVLKPQTQWDPKRYLNIWTVAFGGDAAQLLGYAQFPSLSGLQGLQQNEGAAKTDGVVIRYQSFGRTGNVEAPYDGGRTATHEVGHWLGLRHIWGDGDCSVDDFCDDTPAAGQPNYSCVEINTCGGADRDMVENYMDYTPDGCMSVFTNDQKNRIRTVMTNSPRRKELLTSTVHIDNGVPVDAPVAAFATDKGNVCTGENVQFIDQSSNSPSSWEWRFFDEAGNLLGTFSGQNQLITFNDPGLYTVELSVSNSSGNSTAREENYIAVLSSNLANNLSEDFEDLQAALTDWVLFNPDADRSFQLADVSSFGEGSHSIVFDNFSTDDDPSGTIDALISPRLDFSQVSNPYFYFEHAYAQFSREFSDTLVFLYSLDCGNTFEALWFKGGEDLATAPPTEDSFVPTADEWEWNQISLGFLAGQPSVHLVIANLSGWGNNLYLDRLIFFNGDDFAQGPAEPSFGTATTRVCAGDVVQFQDYSDNFPNQWEWSFEGGNPATSNFQHPFVQYLTPGLYDVSLTAQNNQGGSTAVAQNAIEVVPLPSVGIQLSQQTVCAGDEVTLTATGAAHYIWFDDRSGQPVYEGASLQLTLFEGRGFIVFGENELGCSNVARLSVPVNPVPDKPSIDVQGDVLVASSASAYQWFLNGNPIPGSQGGNNGSYQVQQSGTYSVVVFNAAGCGAISDEVFVAATAIDRLDISESVLLYPNPVTARLQIKLPPIATGQWQMQLTDALGKALIPSRRLPAGSQEAELDMSHLPRGVYFLRLENESWRAAKKIVKQ